jgi:isopenicillin N synthase-like dioxygenase
MPAEIMLDADAIPVIDLGPYLADEPGALDHAAAELRHALTEIGFYSIVNHGVPSALGARGLSSGRPLPRSAALREAQN